MSQTTKIDIDLDVYKTIIQNSHYINEPANNVLKRLLKLNLDDTGETKHDLKKETRGLLVKGVFLKYGLKLRKTFKGKLHEAIVKDGYIEMNNRRYTSPSGAAVVAAGGSVNGWRFWDFLDEKNGQWTLLETLRNK